MKKLFRVEVCGRILSRPASLAITIAVPLAIFGWHTLVASSRDQPSRLLASAGPAAPRAVLTGSAPNLEQVAREAGSIGKFVGVPEPNHAGTKILFAETTETGVGMFFCEIPGGHRRLLYVQPEKGYHVHDINFLGWSPDDKLFAYCRRTATREVVICDGLTGEGLVTNPVSQTIYTGLWLTPRDLVYLDRHQDLREIRQVDGTWRRPNRFKSFKSSPESQPDQTGIPADETAPSTTPITGLTAADGAVVWQQGGDLWRCSYDADAPAKIWASSPTNTLLEFSWSPKVHQYLLHCQDQQGEFLATYLPGRGDLPAQYSELARITDSPATNIVSLAGGNGFACQIKTRAGGRGLWIKESVAAPPFVQNWATIKAFSASEQQLFIVGTRPQTNDLVGIWRYDPVARSLACVVPNQETSLQYVKLAMDSPIPLTNAGGDSFSYNLEPPVNCSPAKKYAMVIGEGWSGYQVAASSAGAYFARVSRDDRSDDQWQADILAVYADVLKTGCVDTNNIYLLGISAGAGAVNSLLEEKPELWRGAILFSPLDFPDLSRIHASKMLVDTGGADDDLGADGRARMGQFRDAALQAGIQLTVATHNDAGHVFRSVGAESERVRELTQFLIEP